MAITGKNKAGARAEPETTFSPHPLIGEMLLLRSLLLFLLSLPPSHPLDWAKGPSDRFVGLRFSCPGPYDARAFALTLRDAADAHAAFGWAQVSRGGSGPLVGEYRGATDAAPAFEALLAAGGSGAGPPCDVLRYRNTLLRFHFADFKILADERRTCFESPPHACNEEGAGNSGGVGDSEGSGAVRSEL